MCKARRRYHPGKIGCYLRCTCAPGNFWQVPEVLSFRGLKINLLASGYLRTYLKAPSYLFLWEFSDTPGWFIVNVYSTTTCLLILAAVFDWVCVGFLQLTGVGTRFI